MKNLSTLRVIVIALVLSISFCSTIFAQLKNDQYTIPFRSGEFLPPNETTSLLKQSNFTATNQVGDKYYVLIQFRNELNELSTAELKAANITLLNYIHKFTYTASIPVTTSQNTLEKFNIRSLSEIPTIAKISSSISDQEIPDWAKNSPGKVDVSVLLQKNVDYNLVEQALPTLGAELLDNSLLNYHLITLRVEENRLNDLANNGFVHFVEPIEAPMEHMNHKGPQSTKSAFVKNNYGYTGQGVVVGVGDGGNVSHIDYGDNLLYQTATADSNWGNHAFHVVGTITGNGNLDPWFEGMAINTKVITEHSSSIISKTADHYDTYGMSLTNNSYGPSNFQCSTAGLYNSNSIIIDQSMHDFPKLLHVFAAGNSGAFDCNPYPFGYGTVIRSYASSKNALIIGAIQHRGQEVSFSSRGPVNDGRIKPEVVTSGYGVVSTISNNSYKAMHGTSMATATATGAAAIITEAYMAENNGEKPSGDVLKAIITNSAEDAGNEGPDYSYGFGIMDVKRAVETIKEGRFVTGSITNGVTNHEFINVPAGTHQVKIMLYWHDNPGSGNVYRALVNNLDMEVLNTAGETFLPWVLDATPANVALPATRGIDTLNNIEQITLTANEITSGLAVKIKATNAPMGPQKYVLVYDIIEPEAELTFPAGGENLAPGYKTDVIRWNAYGPDAENVTLEYSLDNGNSWEAFPLSQENKELRYYNWAIPASVTSEAARVRVTMNGSSDMNEIPFTILPTPSNLTVDAVCGSKVKLSWEPTSSAEYYEVMKLDGVMKVIGETSAATYTVEAPTVGQEEWYTIRPVSKTGNIGSRMVAVNATTTATACGLVVDAGISAILSPIKDGREFTSTTLSNKPVIVEVQNFGTTPISNFPIFYSVNNGAEVQETFTGTLNPGEKTEFTFSTPASINAPGIYNISTRTGITGDVEVDNDTPVKTYEIKQYENEALSIGSFPFDMNFDASSAQVFQENMTIDPLSRIDYVTEGIGGRLKINDDVDFNKNGSTNAITLDATYPVNGGDITNEMILTYNMENFDPSWLEFKLDFSFMKHVQNPTSENRVYARGSDTDTWIVVYDLATNPSNLGMYYDIVDINLLDKLTDKGQQLTSSFQLKFSQTGETFAADILGNDGYTFDNIALRIGITLPIELVSFEAVKEGNDAVLNWTTASELNNKYFEIEMAEETVAGELEDYIAIGKVDGAGNSSTFINYSFLDDESGKNSRRYYRLKQVDFDGSFEYSDIRVLDFRRSTEIEFTVYPNPVLETLSVAVKSDQEEPLKIIVTDMSGKVMENINESQINGSTIKTINFDDSYAEGYYMVSTQIGKTVKTHKVLKVNHK